jgi:hypothetical protein
VKERKEKKRIEIIVGTCFFSLFFSAGFKEFKDAEQRSSSSPVMSMTMMANTTQEHK